MSSASWLGRDTVAFSHLTSGFVQVAGDEPGVGVEGEVVEVVDGYAVLPGVPVSGVTERQPAIMTMNAMVNAARNLRIMELTRGKGL